MEILDTYFSNTLVTKNPYFSLTLNRFPGSKKLVSGILGSLGNTTPYPKAPTGVEG